MPNISVIIPCYNVEKYVARCLNSIIKQTVTDLEIICIDDGSTDSTLKILIDFEKIDRRIKILTQKNLGQSAARNNGLKRASGEFVSFIDSDDYIDINFYEELFNSAITEDAEIIQANMKLVYESLERKLKATKGIYTSFAEKITNISNGSACDKLFKKNFLDKIGIEFLEGYYWEDNFFIIQCLYQCNKLSVIDTTYYNYFQNSMSTIKGEKTEKKRNLDAPIVMKEVLNFLKKRKASKSDFFLTICFCIKNFIPIQILMTKKFKNELRKMVGIKTYIQVSKIYYKKPSTLSKIVQKIKALIITYCKKILLCLKIITVTETKKAKEFRFLGLVIKRKWH